MKKLFLQWKTQQSHLWIKIFHFQCVLITSKPKIFGKILGSFKKILNDLRLGAEISVLHEEWRSAAYDWKNSIVIEHPACTCNVVWVETNQEDTHHLATSITYSVSEYWSVGFHLLFLVRNPSVRFHFVNFQLDKDDF